MKYIIKSNEQLKTDAPQIIGKEVVNMVVDPSDSAALIVAVDGVKGKFKVYKSELEKIEESENTDIKEFIKNYKYQLMYCMTEEEKQNIDIEDLLYYEFGDDPTQDDINYFVESLENNFIVVKHNMPIRHITVK